MINKCKVEMRRGELYNVVKSFKRGGGGYSELRKENHTLEIHSCVFIFCNNIVHVSDRIGSLRPSSLTHPLQIFIVGRALGQGLINRIWARKIVQLQFPSFKFETYYYKKIIIINVNDEFYSLIIIHTKK